jgi:2-desacetyl-2-hydroxyethyl bacteriochlorophyllide A dehydrogenase
MMKALIKRDAQSSYELVDLPIPKPKEDEILIKVEKVSICGSDIPLYKWDETGKKIAKLPFTPGHEMFGTVVEAGAKATDYKVGDRVCVDTHLPCEECWQCKNGVKGICANMGLFGHGVKTDQGGCSQYATAPINAVYKLKTDLPARLACLLEPFGVSHNACEDIQPAGSDMLITGCGPIGLFAIPIAKQMGATRVIAVDVVDYRLQKAKDVGADVVINAKTKEELHDAIMKETNGVGVGRLIECSGAPMIVNNCFSLLRKGGRCVLVGLPKEPLHVDNVLAAFIFRSITVMTIHGRKMFSTWEQSEELLAKKLVNIDPIVTHEFPMTKFEDAFSTLFSGNACKIVLDPQA